MYFYKITFLIIVTTVFRAILGIDESKYNFTFFVLLQKAFLIDIFFLLSALLVYIPISKFRQIQGLFYQIAYAFIFSFISLSFVLVFFKNHDFSFSLIFRFWKTYTYNAIYISSFYILLKLFRKRG